NRFIVGSIIVIVLFFFFWYDDRSFGPEEAYLKWIIYFPILFGVMCYSALTWMNAKRNIEEKVKVFVIDKLVGFMNLNFTYDPDEYVQKKYFNDTDRKSTRLNCSHVSISYAALCLKQKNPPDAYTAKK